MDFIPYGRQNLDEKDIDEVVATLKGDWLTTGPKVGEFEKAICDYINCFHGTAVNSGTSGLDIAIQALELEEGTEVITTGLTFMATSNCLLYNGLKPVYADIEPGSRNISPVDVRKKITDKTKAILFVDYAGHPCDIDELREIAEENDLYLIEDACHALGAEYKGKKIGVQSDMTILSFHPVKHITTGEGGMVVTNDSEFDKKLKMLRNHGIDKDAMARHGSNAGFEYDMKYLGRNYRITDFQCALGLSQLEKIDGFINKRNEMAIRYNELLADIDILDAPVTKPYVKHAWHLYTVLLKPDINRNDLFKYMKGKNIGVNVHYIPTYKFSYYKDRFGHVDNDYPNTEEVFNSIITLPLHPLMTEEQISYICDSIENFR